MIYEKLKICYLLREIVKEHSVVYTGLYSILFYRKGSTLEQNDNIFDPYVKKNGGNVHKRHHGCGECVGVGVTLGYHAVMPSYKACHVLQ